MSDTRIDKWLWAARFFKTRSQAREAIEGGKVHVEGQRSKPSKTVHIGQTITIRQGFSEKTVFVKALDEVRKGASDAAKLYEETTDSILKREKEAEQRRLGHASVSTPTNRPNKKQRRQLLGMKHHWDKE